MSRKPLKVFDMEYIGNPLGDALSYPKIGNGGV